MMNLFFGINGRIGRLQWWIGVLSPWILYMLVSYMIFASYGVIDEESLPSVPLSVLMMILALFVLTVWIIISMTIKRYHDRGKSGWWVLLGFVPIIGIWQVIECGFLAGSPGNNQYGDRGGDFRADDLAAEISAMRRASGRVQPSQPDKPRKQSRPEVGNKAQVGFGRRGLQS